MQWMRLMMTCCGMAVTHIAKGTQNLTCFVYTCMINSKIFFLIRILFLLCHLRYGQMHFPLAGAFHLRGRLRLESSAYVYTWHVVINPLKPELNPICYLLALLGAHNFLHVSRIRVKLLTFRRLMSYTYICGAPILDVSRSHTMTQHGR